MVLIHTHAPPFTSCRQLTYSLLPVFPFLPCYILTFLLDPSSPTSSLLLRSSIPKEVHFFLTYFSLPSSLFPSPTSTLHPFTLSFVTLLRPTIFLCSQSCPLSPSYDYLSAFPLSLPSLCLSAYQPAFLITCPLSSPQRCIVPRRYACLSSCPFSVL